MPPSIATRTGDQGTTSLLYGQRVPKDHPQIEAVGAFDELNAAIGFAKAVSPDRVRRTELEALQRDLVNLMGELACAQADMERYAASKFAKVGEAELARIDAAVAELEAKNLRFDGWATPGGNLPAAALDLARTAARRAERRLVSLGAHGRTVRPVLGQYVNRAADLLWLMAREAGTPTARAAVSLLPTGLVDHRRADTFHRKFCAEIVRTTLASDVFADHIGSMILAVVLILVATAWRIGAAWEPSLANFAPLMALAFCGGVYFRDRRMWLIPFAALLLSDLYLDYYYQTQFGYVWSFGAAGMRALCFVVAIFLGWQVSKQKNWLTLFTGTLGGAIIFYLVTNSHAWWYDLGYAKTTAGWWQAMTIGHPQFPPTLLFFRNSLASDFFFTAMFALAMEYQALRHEQPSLLGKLQRGT